MGKGISFWMFLLTVLVISGCASDDPEDDFGNETGIKGRVMVQNQFQQPLYNERNGISVDLHVGFRDFAVSADNTGDWVLTSAPVGTYTITYSKAGYSQIVVRNILISNTTPYYAVENGYQILPTVTMTKLPLTEFDNFEMSLDVMTQGQDSLYSLNIAATMLPAPPPTGQAMGYRIFIGEDETVSPENYMYQEYYNTTSAAIDITYDNDWFVEQGIHSGDALYAVIYGDVSFNQEIENADGTLIFPNISTNPGGLASVVLP